MSQSGPMRRAISTNSPIASRKLKHFVLIRERTPISAALLARLPRLKLITISGPYPNVDLVPACTAHGVVLCAAANRPTLATPELTWALIMAAQRRIPQEAARRRWLAGRNRRHAARPYARGRRLGRIGKVVAGYGRAFGIGVVVVWSRERGRDEARALGYEIATSKAQMFADADVLTLHLQADRRLAAS